MKFTIVRDDDRRRFDFVGEDRRFRLQFDNTYPYQFACPSCGKFASQMFHRGSEAHESAFGAVEAVKEGWACEACLTPVSTSFSCNVGEDFSELASILEYTLDVNPVGSYFHADRLVQLFWQLYEEYYARLHAPCQASGRLQRLAWEQAHPEMLPTSFTM